MQVSPNRVNNDVAGKSFGYASSCRCFMLSTHIIVPTVISHYIPRSNDLNGCKHQHIVWSLVVILYATDICYSRQYSQCKGKGKEP